MRAALLARTLLPCALLLAAPAALARPADLPPDEKVAEALDNSPVVAAALARVAAARAQAGMLGSGPHEVNIAGGYLRRTVDREGGFNEFDTTVSRAFRLPGKAALDREAGALGVEVAINRMEDARHQAALTLGGLWYDWLAAGSHYRNDVETVRWLEQALGAVRRRLELRDAAVLDLDQAQASLAQALAQASASLARREQARVTLAATFPELPLPVEPMEPATPALPQTGLAAMRDLVVERSHEIRAAEKEAARLDVAARRVRAERMPDPSFGVRLFSERGGAETGIGVVMSVPLGGGYRRAAAEGAAAEASAARMELAAVERSVEAIANADLSNARTRFDAWGNAELSMRSTDEAARKMEHGYQLGETDLAELLYARRLANDARRMEIEARSEANRALLKLEIDSHVIWASDHHE